MRNEIVEKPLLTTRQKEVLIALLLGAAIVAFIRPQPVTWN
ncbi:hypothetical protein WDW37_08095 [Bdellovibrionota bacterium FG-1]